jgi:hypothetical protein
MNAPVTQAVETANPVADAANPLATKARSIYNGLLAISSRHVRDLNRDELRRLLANITEGVEAITSGQVDYGCTAQGKSWNEILVRAGTAKIAYIETILGTKVF